VANVVLDDPSNALDTALGFRRPSAGVGGERVEVDAQSDTEGDGVLIAKTLPARDLRGRESLRYVIPAGVAIGVTAAMFLRRGGFFFPDAVVLSGALCVAAALRVGAVHREDRGIVLAACAFGGWWLLRAFPWAVPHRVVLLPSTVAAFTAAWLIGRSLHKGQRRAAEQLLVGLGAALSVAGLIGVAFRIYPLAMPHAGLWRAAGTLTYANAQGLALAMVLPLALCSRSVPVRWQRAASFLIAAGLVATMSRGALIAAAAVFVVAHAWRSHALVAGALGATVGMVFVWSAGDPSAQPALIALLGFGAGLATIATTPTRRGTRMLLAAAALGASIALVTGSHAPLTGRADPSTATERFHEWGAATQGFTAHPIAGAGPERLLLVDGEQLTYFAHNEYLQLAAGGGLVALGLFALFAAAVARALVRGHASPWAIAALVAVLIGGALDFTWHMPAIGALAGWLASIGTRSDP